MKYVDFFSKLGFKFNENLILKLVVIEENATLTQKLKNSIYFYKSPNNTNTCFYLITTPLETIELGYFRKYVWNKNDADIIFYYPNDAHEVKMYYAKYSPKVSNNDSILEVFSPTQEDLDTLEKIKHWKFDSGVFWLNYHSFIDKAKYKGIDKELVATLKALKEHLSNLLNPLISDESKRNVVVQALIDRTLYIKYLEDNHIINSIFYHHYFNDEKLNFEKLLENNSNSDINKLYKIIHEIFNNALFDQPTIDDKYLTNEVRTLIASSFNQNVNTGQLRLFDFRFDVLPVEFISYIYEVFLSEKQKENGIYYTPKKLAQLIVDDVIKEDTIGSILDPASGSGMFLIVGYQRLLEIAQKQGLEPKNNVDKIRFRTKLLSDNIFGIEKEITAQRFTLFSLSIQIFEGINADEIKHFIANELKQNNHITLFNESNFHENILYQNTLNLEKVAFETKKFRYILGNPPFVGKEVSDDAKHFTNNYKLDVLDKKIIAKDVIDGYQISQCFLLKIKEWSDENTRFGIISNSSNLYNEANKFQNFFYSHYGIEKIYELSRVKKILFEKANESVLAIIFTNNFQKNIIDYYTVDLGLFSEKPFELLIIQEDKLIEIDQESLLNRDLSLRDFLVGNIYDRDFIKKFNNNSKLENYLSINDDSLQGLTRKSNHEIAAFFNLDLSDFKKLSKKEKKQYQREFELKNYLSNNQNEKYPTPYIYDYSKLNHFKIEIYDGYINLNSVNKSYFQRPREIKIFEGNKILITRVGNRIKAVFTPYNIVFSVDIFGVKVKEEIFFNFITSLLNSNFINYLINVRDKKRFGDNLPRIDGNILKNIPIPKELDQKLVNEISDICKDLSAGKLNYLENEQYLNNLIYDLYDLSYWEKQRIKDYFLPKSKIGKNKISLDVYKKTLKEIVEFYFESTILIDDTSVGFNLFVVKISFGNGLESPKAREAKNYLLKEIFEKNPSANFFASQEKIFGKDCVYIIKDNMNVNWTETKAFEDGQDIIKRLISNDGKGIH